MLQGYKLQAVETEKEKEYKESQSTIFQPASSLSSLAEFSGQAVRIINVTWAMNRSAREGEQPRSVRAQTEIKAKRTTPTASLYTLCCLLENCPVKQVVESDALQPHASNLKSASQV